MTDTQGATPGTFVQLGPHPNDPGLLHGLGTRPWRGDDSMSPDLALVLAAVLLAAAEQVSERKLAAFNVSSRDELTILQLAMAFRADDTGLVGDVFEWSLLLAINAGDPGITQLMVDALSLSNLVVDQPQAVLVAAEPGRLVAFSPELPPGAALATGKRGRPPHVANVLESATTQSWKADLLLGSGEKWVTASLKSNPSDLKKSLLAAATTQHRPRIGITASRHPGLTRDKDTDAVLVHVPVHGGPMTLAKVVLTDVRRAFDRHLSLPSTPLQQDATSVGRQLALWQDRTVQEVAATLNDRAALGKHLHGIYAGAPTSTGASVDDATAALVAVNPLMDEAHWREVEIEKLYGSRTRDFSRFEPLD